MNRFTKLVTAAAAVALVSASTLLVASPATAVDVLTDGNYSYTVAGSGNEAVATITRYVVDGAVVVPRTLGGVTVTAIASNSFGYSILTSVTIPSSITSISTDAFSSQGMLTSMTFLGMIAPDFSSSSIETDNNPPFFVNPGAVGYTTEVGDDFVGRNIQTLATPIWDQGETSASATINAGARTASLTPVTFEAKTVSHSIGSTAGTSTLSVNDLSGSGTGWSVTVQASDLSWGANGGRAAGNAAIAASNLSVAASTVSGGDDSDAGRAASVSAGSAGALNNPVTVMSAGAAYGEGAYSSALTFTLSIPANTHNGIYTGTLTTTMSVAPTQVP